MLSDDPKSSMGDSSKKIVMESYQNSTHTHTHTQKEGKNESEGTSVIPTLWSLMLKSINLKDLKE